MADSDGGHVWPPRASDLRIQELTGNGPEGSKPDDVFQALRAAGYVGSLDDMWNQHKAAKGITDTSEIFTGSIALSAAPAPSALANLHGTDGQTTFTDAGTAGSTGTFTGTAELSNAQVLYGSTALDTPGTDGNEMSYDGQGTDYDLGTGDWEIEANVRFDTQAGGNVILELNDNDGSVTTALNAQWQIMNSNASFLFQWSTTGSGWSFQDSFLDFTLSTWHHLSVRRIGNTVYYAIDGNEATTTSDFSAVTLFTPTNPADLNFGPTLDGQIDGVRITIGSTQHPYKGSFRPPSAAFGSDVSDWDYDPTGSKLPPIGYWNYDTEVETYTDANPGGGGSNDSGLDPILDVVDNVSRRLTGLDFNSDGTKCIVCSYGATIASFDLSTAYDLSTATQTGSTRTGVTNPTGVRWSNDGLYYTYTAATDTHYLVSAVTAFEVSTSDTLSGDSISKAEAGWNGSHDPTVRITRDGNYMYSFGRDTTNNHYGINITPLTTAHDFSSFGTATELVLGASDNFITGPAQGDIWLSDDGTEMLIFSGGTNAEAWRKVTMTTPYDASTGTVTSPNIYARSQPDDLRQSVMSWDYQRLWQWDNIFVSFVNEYGPNTI